MAAVSRSVAEALTGPERGFRVLTAWPAVIHLLLDPLDPLGPLDPLAPARPRAAEGAPQPLAECDVRVGSGAREPTRTSHSASSASSGRAAGGEVEAPDRGGRPEVLALLGESAVWLPLGILLAADERRMLAARVGDRGVVGAGQIELAGMTVRASRWWDPSLPLIDAAATSRGEALAAVLKAALPALPDELTGPAARLEAVLQASPSTALQAAPGAAAPEQDAVRDAVTRLLGLGPGLTPAGDDLLVGALAARPGAGLPGAVDAVLAGHPGRTTVLSSALLDQALRGYGLPQLAAVLRALAGPPGAGVTRAIEELAGVGGTSGATIGHGLLLGLRAAHAAGCAA